MPHARWHVLLLVALFAGAGCGRETQDPTGPDHLACGDGAEVAQGNVCCADGRQRPDCTLAVSHSGYWDVPCPEPHTAACAGPRVETFEAPAAGELIGLYTTGPFHLMEGRVDVELDGVPAGAFEARLPPGTVNAPLTLGAVEQGTHTLVLRFTSTDGGVPLSWGGFLDLFLRI